MSAFELRGVLESVAVTELVQLLARGDTRAATEHLAQALKSSPAFQAAVYPAALFQADFQRLAQGAVLARAGLPALVPGSPLVRADLVVLVQLGAPPKNQGGARVELSEGGLTLAWSGQLGDCLILPARASYRVSAAAEQSCLVATLHVQSLVREESQRRVLSALASALTRCDAQQLQGAHVETVRRSYFNLLRRWS